MFGLPIAFVAPALLTAFVILPILYYVLRLTPPPPERVPLPTLPLVRDLVPETQKPQRSPWWLLLLRLTIAALIILAMSGPIWNLKQGTIAAGGPLIILIDNGWASANDWKTRIAFVTQEIEDASERPVFVRGTADTPIEITTTSSIAALEKLRSLAPQAFTPDKRAHFSSLTNFIAQNKNADILWVADGIEAKSNIEDFKNIDQIMRQRLTIVMPQTPQVLGLSNANNAADVLNVRVLRVANVKDTGVVRALDAKGRVLGNAAYKFDAGTLETSAKFDLPLELRNDVSRIEISGENSAGAVVLLDENNSRRRVGILTGESSDTAQPFISSSFFLRRALEPFAEIREAPKGAPNPVERLINDNCNVIILADFGALSGVNLEQLTAYVEKGGMLVRFAGPKLSANMDVLLPVKLRRGGRVLGGALSWDKPRKLGKFPDAGPFAALNVQDDVTVRRQVLAEPDADLPSRSWAQLEDGTPLVTGTSKGAGTVVLFHVTSDTTWSNLPLSGQFVELFRRLVSLANSSLANSSLANSSLANSSLADSSLANSSLANSNADQPKTENGQQSRSTAAPNRILNGFGLFGSPPVNARPVERARNVSASSQHPAGFYGPFEASQAVNTLPYDVKLSPMTYDQIATLPLELSAPIDLRPALLVIAFALFLVDALFVMMLNGAFSKFNNLKFRASKISSAASVLLVVIALFSICFSQQVNAADNLPNIRAQDIESALVTRLAYVVTGDRQVDEDSASGLANLTRILTIRTALEPGDPIGVDLAKDELVFYPILFWTITPNGALPSSAALARINAYMKQGGTIVFDTRDAMNEGIGSNVSPETRRLRQILSSIDVPEIEPVPRTHVVTKSFYLLENFVGRYANGKTWIEVLPPEIGSTRIENRPARAGDRVSPIVITSNDLLSAWATDSFGQPRYPLIPGDARQREFSLRAGVNLVMYSLTGNYKSDQVHIDDLLQRLGQ